jgi:dCTP diphosphatase
MASDSETTVQILKELLKNFRNERDWRKFHTPKDLAEAISIEAGELLELFLWKTPTEIRRYLKSDASFRKAVEDELADVICFSLNFANSLQIDVAAAVETKIAANCRKYPVEKSKGRATKHTQL